MTLYELVGEPTTYEDSDLDEINVMDNQGRSIGHFPFHDNRTRARAMMLAEAVVEAIKCTKPSDSAHQTPYALRQPSEED